MNSDLTNLDMTIERARAQHEQFPLISIKDVAKHYDVSVRTLRRWQAAGLMPSRVKHGRRLMYEKAEIAAMMLARHNSHNRTRSVCLPR
jgi:predicted site-specific integrase-resolvase